LVKIVWKKSLVYTVVISILIVLGNGGLGYWIYDRYQEAVEEEEGYQMQIALAKVKRDKIPSLENEVIKLRENVEKYVKILPDTKEVNDFVRKVSDFVSQSGVMLESLKDDNRQNRRKKKDVFDKETFRIALKGNTFQLLRFLSLVENYERFLKVTEVSIKAGTYDEDTVKQDVVHEVNMLIETFVYHGNEGRAGATKIQNYEKKRKQLKDIIDVRKDIEIGKYEYIFDPSVRDPFIDPRSWASGEEVAGGLEPMEQEKFIDTMMERILEIKGLLEIAKDSEKVPLIRRMELQKEVGQRILELNEQITQSVEENWITDPAYKRKMDQEIMPEVEAINKRVRSIPSEQSAISMRELEFLKKKLAEKFEEEDYDGVMEQYKLVKPRLDQLLTDVEMGSEKNAIVNEIEELALGAGISKEFKAISINITGIICQPKRSVVIVNGQVLTEGQRLQDDLQVHLIEEKAVHFKFKGMVFKVAP
jgi:Tfp pilus assembly protein PilO